MSTEPATVEQPKHPLHAMTTFELREYRRQLESAIAYFDTKNPVPQARGYLQARLDAVLAEQDDRARLARQPEALLRPVDVFEILLPGETSLPLVGIDREAVEVIGASRQRVRLRFPFGKGAVQVASDRTPDLLHLQPLIVLRVLKMRGQILPRGALAAERDHGARSIIFIRAARMTASSSHAV